MYAHGETVYVPSRLLPGGDRLPTSLHQSQIVAIEDRSAKVLLANGEPSPWIPTSKIYDNFGIAIISVGDFGTETTLLNPLAKGILQFCRLLLDDASIVHLRLRAVGELGAWWKRNHAAYSHLVLIGHGSATGVQFGYGGWRSPDDFARRVFSVKSDSKTMISLCCETGRAKFAKPFSLIGACGSLIAPFHSVHGAVASQFLQTFLCWQLLHGRSTGVAFRSAAATVPGRDIFRLWRKGRHVG